MITTFYIIKTISIYFYSLGFSLDTRPHKRQRFNHHRVEIKVVVLYCIVLLLTHNPDSQWIKNMSLWGLNENTLSTCKEKKKVVCINA